MSKIAIINSCDECPHFDNEYYDYNRFCDKLCREMTHDDNYICQIPSDCPLKDEGETP